jgi:hypothetical protein
MLDFGHLSVDKVLVGFVLGEQGQEDVACIIVPVLCNKLSAEDPLVFEVPHRSSTDILDTYPSWRLGQEEHEGNCDNSEKALQS